MENPTQNIFTREQLEQLRRLLDKDPTLFTEVTGKKVPGRKIGQKNPPKAKLEMVPIPSVPQPGQLVTEEVVIKKKKRATREWTDEEKRAWKEKMMAAQAAKKAAGDVPPKAPTEPKPKLTKAQKAEQKLIAEAQAKNCYVRKVVPKVETVVVPPKIAKKPREGVEKKLQKPRVLREDSSDDDSESELSLTSDSEISDGAKTLRKIKKTVAAIRQVDAQLSNGRNFVQMPPMKYNPWGR